MYRQHLSQIVKENNIFTTFFPEIPKPIDLISTLDLDHTCAP